MFISVVVPCYNHASYLQARIESILNQTYQNFEVILLDDLSPDNSAEIILSYKSHPKVSHCIINEKNSGSTFAQWNKGVALAKGDLIWIAESDDVADLTFLETLVPQFELNKNLVLAYCQSYRMDSSGKITGDWLDHTKDLSEIQFLNSFTMNGLSYIFDFLITKNTIPNASAVLFKKNKYLALGGAIEKLKIVGDWDIWLKIISQGDIYYSHEKLNYFRYHSNSVIAKAKKTEGTLPITNQIIEFRENIHLFLNSIDSQNKLLQLNTKLKRKETMRNASHAIRKRVYGSIIPTSLKALEQHSIAVTFIIFTKLIIKLIYSLIIDAPVKTIKRYF
ncbi:glycosyltransferase [Acinetobacter faecalis]|uniref:glycosyltransferase n=1 Tax=Acinetobacter faecalis TaxID=2665161 RepID=UPI002A90B964|nr:glycosyltransferase [Acinetobacter faecalis]MDY6485564.1 glycosyltransferase [Acinetobacter faecalis]